MQTIQSLIIDKDIINIMDVILVGISIKLNKNNHTKYQFSERSYTSVSNWKSGSKMLGSGNKLTSSRRLNARLHSLKVTFQLHLERIPAALPSAIPKCDDNARISYYFGAVAGGGLFYFFYVKFMVFVTPLTSILFTPPPSKIANNTFL